MTLAQVFEVLDKSATKRDDSIGCAVCWSNDCGISVIYNEMDKYFGVCLKPIGAIINSFVRLPSNMRINKIEWKGSELTINQIVFRN